VTNPSPNDSGTLDAGTANPDRETVIPVFEEELSVAKRVVETARVQVSRVTHSHQQMVDELLRHEKVEVERVPINQPIDTMLSIRQEGEVTIIPVIEEVLKVERRLILKEEVHIRRIQHTERHQEMVTLRKQEALVSRVPIEQPAVPADGTQLNQDNPERKNR
jgi:uncharacterized protein (TIGR02271 family)